jgi:hypothetical protein
MIGELLPANWVQVTYATLALFGSALIHSLSSKMPVPCAAGVWITKLVVQVAPPSVDRLTATALALPVRSKARFAYQKVLFGPATTAGSPADSYAPGAVGFARTSPGRQPADQLVPPFVER